MASLRIENGSVDRSAHSRIIVIDVRPFNDFKLGTLPESINFPFSSNNVGADDDAKATLPKDFVDKLSNRRGKIICVVGSGYNSDSQVSKL